MNGLVSLIESFYDTIVCIWTAVGYLGWNHCTVVLIQTEVTIQYSDFSYSLMQ